MLKDMTTQKEYLNTIPEILFDEADAATFVSLKDLFSRPFMDQFQVNVEDLYGIAVQMAHLMSLLQEKEIYPGLYDLADFYLDQSVTPAKLYLTHPERFQWGEKEQDYEWYPVDERIFGDVALFDETTQLMANERLLYKVLIASAKGNVKTPPVDTNADYSSVFYAKLPKEWKEHFITLGQADACLWTPEEWSNLLQKKITGKSHKHDFETKEESTPVVMEGKSFELYVLLRTEEDSSFAMSRLLSKVMGEVQSRCKDDACFCWQGFVYGNRNVQIRTFANYEDDFRVQLENQIKAYSIGEAILLAGDLMKETVEREKKAEYHVHLLAESRLSNDRFFQMAVERLAKLKQDGVKLHLYCTEGSGGEAIERLKYVTQ